MHTRSKTDDVTAAAFGFICAALVTAAVVVASVSMAKAQYFPTPLSSDVSNLNPAGNSVSPPATGARTGSTALPVFGVAPSGSAVQSGTGGSTTTTTTSTTLRK